MTSKLDLVNMTNYTYILILYAMVYILKHETCYKVE
jgi:hypothetical protein